MKPTNCVDCGTEITPLVGAGRTRRRCADCARARNNGLAVERRKRRALAGICTGCGECNPLEGRLLCQTCSDSKNAVTRRIQRQHRADGLCKCGATPQEGYKTCQTCLKVASKRYRTKVLTGEQPK